jgi:hypothetical protein
VPDRDFYYLIGLVAVVDGACKAYSFWADDRSQEKANWDACAQVVESFGDYTLYHYGRYEVRFLDHMRELTDEDRAATVDRIRARSCNVLATIYSHVYFPTYSNGLKDIGTLLESRSSCYQSVGVQQHNQMMAAPRSRPRKTSGRRVGFASAKPNSSVRNWRTSTSAPTRTTSGKRSTTGPLQPFDRVSSGDSGPGKSALG